MQQLPSVGQHPARFPGQIIIYESPGGALCAAVPVTIHEGQAQYSGKTTITLVKRDGEVMTKSFDTLRQVFELQGADPFWLMYADDGASPRDFSHIEDATATVIHDSYTPEPTEENPDPQPVATWKIQYLNRGAARMPQAADRSAVLAKFGSKFRAITPGAAKAPAQAATKTAQATQQSLPAQAPPAVAKKTPPAKKAPPSSTSATAVTATVEEAWSAFTNARPGEEDQDKLGAEWYGVIREMFPGANVEQLTIQQYGALKVRFEQEAASAQ